MEIHTPINRKRKGIQFSNTHISPDVKSKLLSSPISRTGTLNKGKFNKISIISSIFNNSKGSDDDRSSVRKLKFDDDKKTFPSFITIFKYLLILLSLIVLAFALYFLVISLSEYLQKSQLQRDKQYAIRILKEQKGKFNCSEDTEPKYVNFNFIEEKIGKNVQELFNETQYDNSILINHDAQTIEYIGDDFIIPLSCSIKRSFINFLKYYRIIIIATASILICIIYGWIKYKTYLKNQLIIQEMFNECIEILKNCSHSSNEGYIAEDHIKVEVANTKRKRSLWNKVVDLITKDTRIRVTPRQVSGETMTSWKWVSTLHHVN